MLRGEEQEAQKPAKVCVIYHKNCADGFASAFIAWLKFGDKATYHPMHYGDPLPEIAPNSDIYILDFSLPPEQMNQIMASARVVTCLDHHQTAQANWNRYQKEWENFTGVFDNSHCGALLTWKWFFPKDNLPHFFAYIEDRDLWKWELTSSREVSIAVKCLPFGFEEWSRATGIYRVYVHGEIRPATSSGREHVCALADKGKVILDFQKQQIEATLQGVREGIFQLGSPPTINVVTHNGCPFSINNDEGWCSAPVVNCTANISEVGEAMLAKYPDAQFSASYFDDAKGNRIWSLRSRPDFDCSVVAKAFGGGGHKQSAGFTQKAQF